MTIVPTVTAGMFYPRDQNLRRKTMKKARSLILAASLALVSLTAPDAQAQTAAQKFGRGLAGMTTGFLELPGNIVKETRRQGAIGVPIGLAYGVGMIVTRELVGVYEFLTAPFPIPAGFRPILRPEYPWDYFE
jgi:putative exosortase-associated protein (TIGR04073 family)